MITEGERDTYEEFLKSTIAKLKAENAALREHYERMCDLCDDMTHKRDAAVAKRWQLEAERDALRERCKRLAMVARYCQPPVVQWSDDRLSAAYRAYNALQPGDLEDTP